MSFFARKRQKTAVKKKKWEVESDDEGDLDDVGEGDTQGRGNAQEDAGDLAGVGDEKEPEMICRDCKGERDADAFCLSCNLYFCIECFAKAHARSETAQDSQEQKGEVKDKSLHKLRPLVGGRNLSVLEVGWLVGEGQSQVEKKAERDRIQAQKEAEEKARRDAEEKERKDKEAKAAAARKALEAAARATMEAQAKVGQTQPSSVTSGVTPGQEQQQLPVQSKRHIFVSNIPYNAKVVDVRNLFKQCGRIVDVNMPKAAATRKRAHPNAPGTHHTANHRGIAFIEFDSEAGAEAALKLDGSVLISRPIRVCLDTMGPSRNSKQQFVPYKRKMCIYFQQNKCFRGESCSYAHHPSEIQVNGVAPKPNAPGGNVDGGFKWNAT
mmetsp:Transcript_18199/g.44677  ORF Transcript_18199/g.44677 Transcript_18199/m.44677 type:complete len:381 (+) Transcript_18199:75-1217(+)